MRRWRLGLVGVGIALVAAGVPAYALAPVGPGSPQPIGTLDGGHDVLSFSGTFTTATPLPTVGEPEAAVCLTFCQRFTLRVATPEPFLVAVKNANNSLDEGLELYVYDPSGRQVAAATGIGADGQAVAVPARHPQGTYTVAVTETYQYDPQSTYLGDVRLMTGASWSQPSCPTSAPCALLPRLAVLPPTDVRVNGVPPVASTPLGFPFPVDLSTGNSCYLDETASTGATRCLRFTSDVENVGVGALALQVPLLDTTSTPPSSGVLPGECEAEQVITYSDGSTRTLPAGPCEFHPQHAHFHYDAFAGFTLVRDNADGTRTVVGHSLKESFCLADDDYFGFRQPAPNGPRDYTGQPGCSLPAKVGPSGALIEMGLTPGWGDVYTWDTPDQYIDISNVPPGTYDIVAQANPSGLLHVADPASPCASTTVQLTATSVQVVGSDPDATCPTP